MPRGNKAFSVCCWLATTAGCLFGRRTTSKVFEGCACVDQAIRRTSNKISATFLARKCRCHCVIFDTSGSINDKLDRAREAIVEFFKTANPQDEFFMIAFSDKPEELSDFTSSVEDIHDSKRTSESQLLDDITRLNGGHAFTVDTPNDLLDVATKIGIELRNQYVLGYPPKDLYA